MSWRPSGEAQSIYYEFVNDPDYSKTDYVDKLIICLVYEKQYASAIALSKASLDIFNDEKALIPYLFSAIAWDMKGDRAQAIRAYNEILKFDIIPSYSMDQFGIEYTCREFIEYLRDNSYTPENVEKFDFPPKKETFEHKLWRELPVVKTPHFNIYCYPGSTAEKEMAIIKAQREDTYRKIAEFLGLCEDLTIDLYFFEDGETKRKVTGHTGAGWAYGTSMVEVYNEQTKVNPYHELVHVVMDYLYGPSVSAFSEGFAVYLCNLFNDMPSSDKINDGYGEKIKDYHRNGELFTLTDLLSFEIGHTESKPLISYPQAASFIEYAISKLTKVGFISLYASLHEDYSPDGIAGNIAKIEGAFECGIYDIEKEWLEYAL